MTGVLILGIKLSSRVTAVIVAIKVAIVLLVIVVGIFYVQADNYTPFVRRPSRREAAAAGRPAHPDAVRVHAEHVRRRRHPRRRGDRLLRLHRLRHRRDRGRGDEGPEAGPAARHHRLAGRSARVLYVAVSLVVVGMQHYTELSRGAARRRLPQRRTAVPLRRDLRRRPRRPHLGRDVLMLGQSRVLFAMSRDRLCRRGSRRCTPVRDALQDHRCITGVVVAVLAGFVRSARSPSWSARHAVRVRAGLDQGRRSCAGPARTCTARSGCRLCSCCRSSPCWPAST